MLNTLELIGELRREVQALSQSAVITTALLSHRFQPAEVFADVWQAIALIERAAHRDHLEYRSRSRGFVVQESGIDYLNKSPKKSARIKINPATLEQRQVLV